MKYGLHHEVRDSWSVVDNSTGLPTIQGESYSIASQVCDGLNGESVDPTSEVAETIASIQRTSTRPNP
jgi:hypothetical protein